MFGVIKNYASNFRHIISFYNFIKEPYKYSIKKIQLTYCHEQYSLDYETHDSYYPMVSFCDIPLSLAKDQIEKYGSYAIGMTKEWGIKNSLNPVVYIEKDSYWQRIFKLQLIT